MSQKSDGSSSSFTPSMRWMTDFREIDGISYIRPPDDVTIPSPSTSSSLDDENPLTEMKSLKQLAELGGPVCYPEDEDDLSLSSSPLDVNNTPSEPEVEFLEPEQEPEEHIPLEPTTLDIPIPITRVTDVDDLTETDGRKSVSVEPASTLSSQISTDLSLDKIEAGPLIVNHHDEDSLDLFTDVKKKVSPRVPPPRPPKPRISAPSEVHPLMQVCEPDPEPDFMSEPPPARSTLSEKLSKTAGILKKKGKPQGPLSDESDINPSEGLPPEPVPPETPSTEKDNTSITSTDSHTSSTGSQSKKQKFKAMRNSLYSKAYSKYNQYYDYYYNAERRKQLRDQELDKATSESESEGGGFYEITAEDVSTIPEIPKFMEEHKTSDQDSGQQSAQLDDSSDLEDSSYEDVTPEDPHTFTETTKPGFSVHYQNHIIFSGAVCLFSAVLYITVFYLNSFYQGFVTGAIIPLSLGSVVFYLSRPEKEDEVKAAKNLLAAKRLRKLGSGSSIKDFFQYTETHNFGEIRIMKNVPYRYFKLKGPVIHCFELNATKEQVPDPLKLTENEIKSYGLKPVFKEDISGWLVTVEAPPGSRVTSSNRWKKRYPIWLRKKSWRTEVDEYGSGDRVSSFYLFSPYSRYKEHWYEALKRAVIVSDCSNSTDLTATNYKEFMETLFSQIPNVDTKVPDSTDNADDVPKRSSHSAWINALFGRFVWNIVNDKKWEDRIKERIVRKLSSVKTKHISSLELKSFDLGNTVPLITKTYLPKIDHQGVWSEMQFDYCGEVSLSLVAKLNSKPTTVGEPSKSFETMKLESSSASSSSLSSSPGRLSRFYRILDRIEIGVSAKVTKVAGRLCVNIPPPPTDCLWYGFREPPELKIHLTPILGKWISLDYKPISNALNKQLQTLFNETFVLPAMENIVMPGMSRGMTSGKQDLPETLDINQLAPQPLGYESESPQELLDVAGGVTMGRRGTSPSL